MGHKQGKINYTLQFEQMLGESLYEMCPHVALFLCHQFLSLESMYRIVDNTASMGSDANQIAIINVFEEFIGCAVSID